MVDLVMHTDFAEKKKYISQAANKGKNKTDV